MSGANETGRSLSPSPWAERWLPALPAVVLAVVALTQVSLARRAGLSPWKGGGFGMFSTLDARPHRHLRIHVEGEGTSEERGVPGWAQAEASVVETLPTDAHFERLGRTVVAHEQARGRAPGRVRLELWRDEHDVATLQPTSRKLREYVYRVAP